MSTSLLLTACDTRVGGSMWLIGDSIAQQAADDLCARMTLTNRAPLCIVNAVIGAGLKHNGQYWVNAQNPDPQGPPGVGDGRIEEMLKENTPDVIVVSLLTNDDDATTSYGAQIDAFLGVIPSSTPVWWISPNLNASDAADKRSALSAALATHPNLTVIDGNSFAHATGDIHMNAQGQRALAGDICRRAVALGISDGPC